MFNIQDDGQLLKNYINGTADNDPPNNTYFSMSNEPLTVVRIRNINMD